MMQSMFSKLNKVDTMDNRNLTTDYVGLEYANFGFAPLYPELEGKKRILGLKVNNSDVKSIRNYKGRY